MKTNIMNAEQDSVLINIVVNGCSSENVSTKREADKAFEKLFDKYKGHLLFIAQRGMTDKVVAEDLVMRAFENAYKSLNTYNCEKAAFNTWLYNILTNVTIDHFRQRKEVDSLSTFDFTNNDGEEIPVVFVDSSANPEQQIVRDDVHNALRHAINNMKHPFLTRLLHLRYFNEMSYEEIAKKTGKPLGTVKANLNRAKILLREKLKDNPLFK
jgi:RNA polymerase sigma-70 factor (ECF subfamily)